MNNKLKFVFLIGLLLSLFSNSCDDSLGIEENYSQKLISGDEISEQSYKEYVIISRDTIIFVSDTITYNDTITVQVFDTVETGYKVLPNKGMIYSKQYIPFVLFNNEFMYRDECSFTESQIDLVYTYNDTPLLSLNFHIDFPYPSENTIFNFLSETPSTIDLSIKSIIPHIYNRYYFTNNNDTFFELTTIDKDHRINRYNSNNITSYLKIIEIIRSPENDNHILVMHIMLNTIIDKTLINIPFSIVFY